MGKILLLSLIVITSCSSPKRLCRWECIDGRCKCMAKEKSTELAPWEDEIWE